MSRSTNRLTWITDIEFLLLVEKTGNWSVASCRFETSLRVFLFLLVTYAPLASFVERLPREIRFREIFSTSMIVALNK